MVYVVSAGAGGFGAGKREEVVSLKGIRECFKRILEATIGVEREA